MYLQKLFLEVTKISLKLPLKIRLFYPRWYTSTTKQKTTQDQQIIDVHNFHEETKN